MKKMYEHGKFYYTEMSDSNKLGIYKKEDEGDELLSIIEYNGIKNKPRAHGNAAFICARIAKYTELQEANETLQGEVKKLSAANNNIPYWLNEAARVLELYAEKKQAQSTIAQKLRWYADNIEAAINNINQQ